MTPTNIQRGEIWSVRFDPSEGDEIRKIRPAIVMNTNLAGRMRLRLVVPITGWHPSFTGYFWMVKLIPSPANGLSKESAADCFQVKSVSTGRFHSRLGQVTADELVDMAAAIALCVGHTP